VAGSVLGILLQEGGIKLEASKIISEISEIEMRIELLCSDKDLDKQYPAEHSKLCTISGELGGVIQDIQFLQQEGA